MKLVSDREYNATGGEVKMQGILNGGTAVLSVKTSKAAGFTAAKTWSADEVVIVDLPQGKYKVTLTGSAEVTLG